MALTIIRGTNQKPASSQALSDSLGQEQLEGELYIGFPILGTADGRLAIDALLISQKVGLVVFDLVEGADHRDFELRQDEAANMLESKLRLHRELVAKRQLQVRINTLTFGPAIPNAKLQNSGDYPVANGSNLTRVIRGVASALPDTETYDRVRSAVQNISTIRQSRARRTPVNPDSRGAKLKMLEDSIATLDNMQSRAVIETVEGVQRIRGLAGSGKTIVLALKAAYLHAQHPDWRIAVTFNTRSLKAQFRRLINTFCVAQTGEEPDWEQIRVINAWGAPGGTTRDGLYYEFCRIHGLEYYDYERAKLSFGQPNAFRMVCRRALGSVSSPERLYNAILIDEAQDFPLEFLRLCYELLGEGKHLVYAYDELQNLAGETVPPPEVIFGTRPDGAPVASLSDPSPSGARRDIILHVCYRNSRPLLTSAHALGFGVYRTPKNGTTGLVQMFDYPALWSDIGYRVKSGSISPGQTVVLERTSETSPPFLEGHSPAEDLIQFIPFGSKEEQNQWLVEQIKRNLEEDELRAEDIVVINPDPLTTRSETGPIRAKLLQLGIDSHLAGVTTDPDVFFVPESGSVTFTGVFRAKGNEAGMVYIINAHDCYSGWNLASVRNRLFTAMTRSKAWVRVLGTGNNMELLAEEFNRVRQHNFELEFNYPTEEERKHLAIIHRDVSRETRRAIETTEKGLRVLLSEVEAGNAHIEDLDPELVNQLRQLLEPVED